jgi:hypothetical protein
MWRQQDISLIGCCTRREDDHTQTLSLGGICLLGCARNRHDCERLTSEAPLQQMQGFSAPLAGASMTG